MTRVFVYYCDDVGSENEGIEKFDNRQKAAEFIANRMSDDPTKVFEQYTVIEGAELKITAVELIKSVRLDLKYTVSF